MNWLISLFLQKQATNSENWRNINPVIKGDLCQSRCAQVELLSSVPKVTVAEDYLLLRYVAHHRGLLLWIQPVHQSDKPWSLRQCGLGWGYTGNVLKCCPNLKIGKSFIYLYSSLYGDLQRFMWTMHQTSDVTQIPASCKQVYATTSIYTRYLIIAHRLHRRLFRLNFVTQKDFLSMCIRQWISISTKFVLTYITFYDYGLCNNINDTYICRRFSTSVYSYKTW